MSHRALRAGVWLTLFFLGASVLAGSAGQRSAADAGKDAARDGLTGERPLEGDAFPPGLEEDPGMPSVGETPPVVEEQTQAPLLTPPSSAGCNPPLYFSGPEDLRKALSSGGSGGNMVDFGSNTFFDGTVVASGVGSGPTGASTSYSSTNNQVSGVDELDQVKTDGRYIYAVANNSVVIVDAYPAESARVVARLTFPSSYWNVTHGLFLAGDRLVVVRTSQYSTTFRITVEEDGGGTTTFTRSVYYPQTQALVYDVADPSHPALASNITAGGTFLAARLIGPHVYLATSWYAPSINVAFYGWYSYATPGSADDRAVLPSVWVDGLRYRIEAAGVSYFPDSWYSRQVAVLLGFDVRGGGLTGFEALLLNAQNQVYVSPTAIYLAGYGSGWWGGWSGVNTTVHKFALDAGRICYVASGVVPGTVLSQFAMDERGSYLRVATASRASSWWTQRDSNVYVLNATLAIVGRLEGLARGEDQRAVRFVGDRGYLVTLFVPVPIDPLLVIDLSDPFHPTLLGELVIPGFSTYLHPLDDTHLLGAGQDTCPLSGFRCAKLSLFDVSDPAQPKETSKYLIGDYGSSSLAGDDHHAFLLHAAKGLVVVPATVYPSGSGGPVWRGAYVLSVSTAGIALRGTLTHFGESACGAPTYYYPYYASCAIDRSLYINEVLYTLSDFILRANNLDTLAALRTVTL